MRHNNPNAEFMVIPTWADFTPHKETQDRLNHRRIEAVAELRKLRPDVFNRIDITNRKRRME